MARLVAMNPYSSIAKSPPKVSKTLESSALPIPAPPVDILVVAEVVVVGVPLELILEVYPLALDTDPHSLATLDDIFSGAVWQ